MNQFEDESKLDKRGQEAEIILRKRLQGHYHNHELCRWISGKKKLGVDVGREIKLIELIESWT